MDWEDHLLMNLYILSPLRKVKFQEILQNYALILLAHVIWSIKNQEVHGQMLLT